MDQEWRAVPEQWAGIEGPEVPNRDRASLVELIDTRWGLFGSFALGGRCVWGFVLPMLGWEKGEWSQKGREKIPNSDSSLEN